MSDFVFRDLDEVFDSLSDEERKVLDDLDRADRERIAARRRYEEFVDMPSASGGHALN